MKKMTNIVIFGFMGTGKTTVGQILAEKTGKIFLDMDKIIEKREKRPISAIFESDGEAFFRDLERNLVRELSEKEDQVIATGGGVVLNAENVSDFEKTGLVVCLMARPETILARVASQTHRPLLEEGDKARRIMDILAARKKLYESIPWTLWTDDLSSAEVAEAIFRAFEG